MPEFVMGRVITTTEPTIVVDPTLRPGVYTFQLIVEDEGGNRSEPFSVNISIEDSQNPRASISAPDEVPLGEPITLDGSNSRDVAPGLIVAYHWMLVRRNQTGRT